MSANSLHQAAGEAPILLVPYMWIGDFVRCHSVVKLLRQRHPDRPVDVLTTTLCAPLLDYMPGVRKGIVCDLPRKRLALAEQHPDLRVVEPEGNTFRKDDAERVVRHATLAPIEGEHKVIVASGCEAMEDEAAGYLLKIIEEPPASTIFVLLATEVVPELVSWKWQVSERKGLARLDYTQNAVNKTLVAPYSPRATPGATVSMPIDWEELDDPDLRPCGWTIFTAPDRLRERGDLFRRVLDSPGRLPRLT